MANQPVGGSMLPHVQPGGGNRPGGGLAMRPGGGGFGSGGGLNPGGNRPGGGVGPNPGNRPGAGGGGEQWPSGSNRPNWNNRPGAGGGGEQWPGGVNRPGWANRPGAGGGGEQWPSGGSRPNWNNRPGAGGGGEQWPGGVNRPGWVNRPGAGGGGEQWPLPGHGPLWPNRPGGGSWNDRPNRPNYWVNNGNINRGNNVFNQTNINQNNITSISTNRFSNYNGNPWGYNHYHANWANWHAGSWSNWNTCPSAWYTAGAASAVAPSLLWGNGTSYAYSNPFYVSSPTIVAQPALDYSQPIQVPAPVNVNVDNSSYAAPVEDTSTEATATPFAAAPPAPSSEPAANQVPPEATEYFNAARSAFKSEDYRTALDDVEAAIKVLPKDATLHEFRALVLFAQGKYKEAASGIYAVLSVGPGWNWETMSGLYANVDTYTKQLRALEAYVRDNPNASDGRFLVAYQYLVMGAVPNAVRQLQEFEKIVPGDQLAPQLAKAFTQPADSNKPKAEGT
jgi:tetratricopeptide (TPR) repeat protein